MPCSSSVASASAKSIVANLHGVAADRPLRRQRRRQELAPPCGRCASRCAACREPRGRRRTRVLGRRSGRGLGTRSTMGRREPSRGGTLVERLGAASRRSSAATSTSFSTSLRSTSSTTRRRRPGSSPTSSRLRSAAPGLRANFLVGAPRGRPREARWFKGQIPNLFANYLRLDHLDRDGGRAAILGPIERYNELAGRGESSVEPELVEAVLDQVAAGRVDLGRAGRGGVETDEERIEAPYLQLVLERLWEVERAAGRTSSAW